MAATLLAALIPCGGLIVDLVLAMFFRKRLPGFARGIAWTTGVFLALFGIVMLLYSRSSVPGI
jgi:Ni/Fe-hydrogenase subunit HybB-like protein